MGETTERRMLDGSFAPTCMVRFRCINCKAEAVLDAYEGVARHNHDGVKFVMEPMTVVREGNHPYPGTPTKR